MELYLLIACVILSAAAAVFAALSLKRAAREQEGAELAQLRAMQEERERALRRELADATQRTVGSMGEMLLQNQQRMGASLERNLAARQETMNKAVQDMHKTLETRFGTFATENEQKLENIRKRRWKSV